MGSQNGKADTRKQRGAGSIAIDKWQTESQHIDDENGTEAKAAKQSGDQRANQRPQNDEAGDGLVPSFRPPDSLIHERSPSVFLGNPGQLPAVHSAHASTSEYISRTSWKVAFHRDLRQPDYTLPPNTKNRIRDVSFIEAVALTVNRQWLDFVLDLFAIRRICSRQRVLALQVHPEFG